MTGSIRLQNAIVLDPVTGDYHEGELLILGGRVADAASLGGSTSTVPQDIRNIDLRGGFVLPGLIDCHVHVKAATADDVEIDSWPASYLTAHAARLMGDMLDRGFTTVRDTGGADFGLAQAQAEGLIRGPRLLFGGRSLSQTGGHSDQRGPGVFAHDDRPCCGGMGQIADGVDEVRRAARHILRTGAHHIKVMASGGVASPTDRIDSTGYSMDELRAVVQEAEAANRYVAAHAYTAKAINRALEAGIRTIEHGNLLDESSLKLLQHKGAHLVMNLVTYWALDREGAEYGLPAAAQAKIADVLDGGYRALEMACRAGVPAGYGTDLLGGMQRHQLQEFAIRAELQPAIDVIRAATTVAASIVRMEGEIGCLAAGAHGDAIVLDRDPVQDISALVAGPRMVIQAGSVVAENGPR